MDTYAKLYSGKEYNTIPEHKRKEFSKIIEKLFQAGGMMRIKPNILYGKRVYTIHKIKMGKSGVRFNYNYFEENIEKEVENMAFADYVPEMIEILRGEGEARGISKGKIIGIREGRKR